MSEAEQLASLGLGVEGEDLQEGDTARAVAARTLRERLGAQLGVDLDLLRVRSSWRAQQRLQLANLVAAGSADNTLSNSLTDSERVANREYYVTDIQPLQVGNFYFRQVVEFNFEHGEVGIRVGANETSFCRSSLLRFEPVTPTPPSSLASASPLPDEERMATW